MPTVSELSGAAEIKSILSEMPKQVKWKEIDHVNLDARDELRFVPPLLDGFSHRIWERVIQLQKASR